jgi:integrase
VTLKAIPLEIVVGDREMTVLSAAVTHVFDFDAVQHPTGRAGEDPVRPRSIIYLTPAEADRLIASYAHHVRPIATVLAFQGLRIGDALRLDWVHVRWATDALFIPDSKSGEPRTVCLHERSRRALHAVWVAAGSPASGRVFLNRLGQPYADQREYRLPGGSPIKKAHATACRRAGIPGFRVHDWRHHWACHCVMSGIDLETLRLEGHRCGWSNGTRPCPPITERRSCGGWARVGQAPGVKAKDDGETAPWREGPQT